MRDLGHGYRKRLDRARHERRPPRRLEVAEVDWEEFLTCKVCPAPAGWRCIDLILDGGRLVAVRALDQPHLSRRRRPGNWAVRAS